jgi:hypothetical protein
MSTQSITKSPKLSLDSKKIINHSPVKSIRSFTSGFSLILYSQKNSKVLLNITNDSCIFIIKVDLYKNVQNKKLLKEKKNQRYLSKVFITMYLIN